MFVCLSFSECVLPENIYTSPAEEIFTKTLYIKIDFEKHFTVKGKLTFDNDDMRSLKRHVTFVTATFLQVF